MKITNFITHLLAVGMGMLVAAFAFPERAKPLEVDTPGSPTHTVRKSSSRPRGQPQSAHPRALLEESLRRPMESHHRRMLVRQLRLDWATDDPQGFLVWYQHQPTDHHFSYSDDAVRKAFETLARADPEWLLSYARQYGDSQAMWALATDGDPHAMLRMYLEHGESKWPDGWISQLFSSGAKIDSDFHHRIFELPSPALRADAARAFSSIMFDANNQVSYAQWLAKNANELPLEILARDLGTELAKSQLV